MTIEQLSDPTVAVWMSWASVLFLLIPGIAVAIWDYHHYYRSQAKTPLRTNVHLFPTRAEREEHKKRSA